MGAKLKEAGYHFTVIEKNDNVGGTWYENTYPGIAVDTPNHFYSYSFRMEPNWDHYFARGDEIQRYIETCYAEMGIADHVRFEQEVISTVWDKDKAVWNVKVRRKDGSTYEEAYNAVISAAGLLNVPSFPTIPGMDRFKGPLFHSAHWDHSLDLKGKTVAVIGTGASGQQIVPAIADEVGKLVVWQRSPHWVRPNPLIFQDSLGQLEVGARQHSLLQQVVPLPAALGDLGRPAAADAYRPRLDQPAVAQRRKPAHPRMAGGQHPRAGRRRRGTDRQGHAEIPALWQADAARRRLPQDADPRQC